MGRRLGLVDDRRWAATQEKTARLAEAQTFAETERLDGVRLSQWLRRPEAHAAALPEPFFSRFPAEIWSLLETDLKYEGYIRRQEAQVERARAGETRLIPSDLDYAVVPELRAEARQKFATIRPATFGQAGRISGITPADLALLEIWLRKRGGLTGKAV